MRRAAVVIGTTLALAGALLSACGGGGPSRSEESFCTELKEGAAKLDKQTAEMGDDLGGLLGGVLNNVADYSRLIRRLNERAPEEIKSDMEAAAELWEKQADGAKDVASNPLGALANAFMNSLMSASSIEAVDEYANEHCGRPVFGFVGSSSSAAAGDPCPTLGEEVVLTGNVSDLTTRLREARVLKLEGAKSLLDALARLTPKPKSAVEGLGRLAFDSVEPAVLAKQLNESATETCKRPVLDSDLVSALAERTPRPEKNGFFRVGGYTDSCSLATHDPIRSAKVVVVSCEDSYGLLDFGTGLFTTIKSEPLEHDYYAPHAVVGDRYVWWEKTKNAAQGLTAESTTFVFRSRNFTGGDVKELSRFTSDGFAGILGVSGDRVLTIEQTASEGEADMILRDVKTGELARAKAAGVNDYGYVFGGVVVRGLVTFDLDLGKLAPSVASRLRVSGTDDTCAGSAVAYADGGRTLVRRTASGWQTAKVPDVGQYVAKGDVLVKSDGGTIKGFDRSGRELWQIPDDVVDDWVVFGGYVFVQNASDEVVPVDPATGKETTVSAALKEAATVAIYDFNDMQVSARTGIVLLPQNRAVKLLPVQECKLT